jgi:hypothetical protein
MKLLIGALVGGILVFGWQTLSWTVLKLHDKEYQKAANEDNVISYLSSQFNDDGQYFIPMGDPDASTEQKQKFMDDMKGKPWAVVSYHKAYDINMIGSIIRGFLSTLVAVLFVCWILMKNTKSSFFSTFISCVLIGVTGYIFFPYSGIIWFQNPGANTLLMDTIVAWGACGIWLGWWLNRK